MPFETVRLLILLALRNIWRNPRRSLITLFAVVLGIVSCTALSSLARGVSYGMRENAVKTLTAHIQLHAQGYLDDPSVERSMIEPAGSLLEALEGSQVKAWAARVRVPAVLMSERESVGVTFLGISPAAESKISFIGKSGVVAGEMLRNDEDKRLLVGGKLLELLETGLGKRVVIITQNSAGKTVERGFRIAGVFDAELEATEKTFVFSAIQTAQKMLDMEEQISEVALIGHDLENLDPTINALRSAAPSVDLKTWKELEPFIRALLQVQGAFISFWFLIVVIAVSFGLINTLFMSILERTREIGLVEALGMKPALVVLMVVFESLTLLLFGVIAGNLMGLAVVWLLKGGVDLAAFAAGVQYIGFSRIIYPVIVARDWLVMNMLVFVVGIVSSMYPAWRASRTKAIEALKTT